MYEELFVKSNDYIEITKYICFHHLWLCIIYVQWNALLEYLYWFFSKEAELIYEIGEQIFLKCYQQFCSNLCLMRIAENQGYFAIFFKN